MEDLKVALDEHKKLPFPDMPQDEKFSDWAAELAQTDGYYFGLGSSIVNGSHIHNVDTSHLRKLKSELPNSNFFREIL